MIRVVKRVRSIQLNKKHPDYSYLMQLLENYTIIYNQALFLIRQKSFKATGKEYSFDFERPEELDSYYKNYFSDDKMFNKYLYTVLTNYNRYHNLEVPAYVIANLIQELQATFKGYFQSIKKKETIGIKRVGLPRYYKIGAYAQVPLGQQIFSTRLYENTKLIGTTKMKGVDIGSDISFENVKMLRVRFKNKVLVLDVIYDKEIQEQEVKMTPKVATIDLGIDNLATIVFNYKKQPLILSGKVLKSVNQYFNKKVAYLQSKLPKNQKSSKRIFKITLKRNNKIKTLLHQYTCKLVDLIKEENIGTLIIGYNKGFKQNSNLGKKANQKFVQIPYLMFINMLTYKLDEIGVLVKTQEESYTSKASFLDKDSIGTKGKEDTLVYSGVRKTRGMYISKQGKEIHADVNAAYNIQRKANIDFIEDLCLDTYKKIVPKRLNFRCSSIQDIE